MIFQRSVKQWALTTQVENWTQEITSESSPLEVIKSKLGTRPMKRTAANIVFSGGHGAVMYPQDSLYAAAQNQIYTVCVYVGIFGGLLLTLLGCTIFKLCKKRDRGPSRQGGDRRAPQPASERRAPQPRAPQPATERRAPQPASERRALLPASGRRTSQPETPDAQQSPNKEETDIAPNTSEQYQSVCSGSDREGFQYKTASRRTTPPIHYSVLPGNDNADVSFDKDERFRETSFTESVGEIQDTDVYGTIETESAGEPSPGTRQAETVNDVAEVTNRTEEKDAASTSLEGDEGLHSDDKNTGIGHEILRTQETQEALHDSEKNFPGVETRKNIHVIQDDAADDMCGCQTTSALDESLEPSDSAEEERMHESSSRGTTDDSIQSFESFSCLQNVKAQAEFSPYHIAWSTPLFPQFSSVQRRHSHKVPAAKRLNMDDVCAKPSDKPPNCHDKTKSAEMGHFLDTVDCDSNAGPGQSENIESSGPSVWVFLKPQDVWCRPVSAEYRTPRPTFKKEKYGSLLSVSEDLEEQKPLLPYSVTEYRRSQKNIAAGKALDSKEVVSSEHLYSSACSPESLHSFSSIHRSLANESCACRTLSEASTVGSGSHDEDTLQNLRSSSVNGTIDSTTASWLENTHSSIGDWNSSAISASRYGSALKNKGSGEDTLDKEMLHLQGTLMQSSCIPLSSTSPSCLLSAESDHPASLTPSSSEKSPHSWGISPEQEPRMRGARMTDDDDLPRLASHRPSTVSTPKSQALQVKDNFKIPGPVSSSASIRRKEARPLIPRSKSSTNKPLVHEMLLKPDQIQMRRSKTSDSISSSSRDQHVMSLGSCSDISAAGSSVSGLSSQDPSLMWDNEFTASGRGHDDSLAWEDDPCLD